MPKKSRTKSRTLRANELESFRVPGRYGVGDQLYLQIAPAGARSWIFRYARNGRRHDLGLGRFPATTLVAARTAALEARRLLARGGDPLAERRANRQSEAGGITFDSMVETHLTRRSPGWRNEKHSQQWRNTLATYASQTLGSKDVREITTADVEAVLRPIWITKHETATRVRQRIESILDAATALGFRDASSANPARLKGNLDHLLPVVRKTVQHHAALQIDAVPIVMRKLSVAKGMAALCLRFIMLTASRASEAADARWGEIDLARAIWTVPAERMKAGREHRVPLSSHAAVILREAKERRRKGEAFVFAGGKAGKPLSLTSLMKALRIASSDDSTVHGLRSTFRDWCSESDHAAREVAEAALAHAVGSTSERAYARSDVLERRRELLQRWASFACGGRATTRPRR